LRLIPISSSNLSACAKISSDAPTATSLLALDDGTASAVVCEAEVDGDCCCLWDEAGTETLSFFFFRKSGMRLWKGLKLVGQPQEKP
jgi:hypothetical protein